MSDLANLQRAFSAAIFSPQLTADSAIFQHIATSTGPNGRQRLGIYRAAVFSSFSRVLEEVYPVVARLLGDEFFSAMARLYALEYPSTQPDLNHYGNHMAVFIEQFEPLKDMPYLVDLARLEWYWHEIFYAADSPPNDFERLAAVDENEQGDVVLTLSNAARVLHSNYPVKHIWHQNQPQVGEPEQIDLSEGGETLIIWRSHNDRRVDALNRDQWQLLQSVSSGMKLADLLAQPDMTTHISQLLPDCIRQGWVCFQINE
jgi:hypothetical protein